MNRTGQLKHIALDNSRRINLTQRDYLFYKAIAENPPQHTHNLRRAGIDAMILDNYPIAVNSLELLVGRPDNDFVMTEEQQRVYDAGRLIRDRSGITGGFSVACTGHRVIDYEKLLNLGIKGVLAQLDEGLRGVDYASPDAAEKKSFFLSCKISLEAVCRYAGRVRDELLRLAEAEETPQRKAELERMADNFRSAPYEPCTGFYEALQCTWFMQFCLFLLDDVSLTGRPDNYLYPFYKRDLESGAITRDFALELIENLYFKHNEIYGTWPASIMVGGVDRDGNNAFNELSELFIEAIETTGLINPSVSVCYTEDMPDSLLEKCVDIIAKGYTRPSIFNDRVVQQGLLDAGAQVRDARYYIHSTCVEITPIASSNVMVATPYINLNKAFEYILNGGKQIYGDWCHVERDIPFSLDSLTDFGEFKELAKSVAAEIIRTYLSGICDYLYSREKYTSSPLQSAFTDDCIKRGKDAVAGGAKYSYIYPCFPGFVNFVDSLSAIKKAVYEEKILTLDKLSALCRDNFGDGENLRQYLVNLCPKFGNNISESDELAVEIYEFIRSELKKYVSSVGGTFHPSFFAWIMHGMLGSQASATPDGRRQGEALSECLGSVQGMDKNGPVALMRSISKIEQKYGIGGIATNFRFSKSLISTPEGKKAIMDFIKVFMDNDCFEIQFNIVDQAQLLEAQKNPEKYQGLMVRVAGYKVL
ncbi:MAG: pyruvate formate lyase family protein, partial [Eubacteriales bacterium]